MAAPQQQTDAQGRKKPRGEPKPEPDAVRSETAEKEEERNSIPPRRLLLVVLPAVETWEEERSTAEEVERGSAVCIPYPLLLWL